MCDNIHMTTTEQIADLTGKLAGIDGEIHSTKILAYNASQMCDARGYGRLERELDRKYRVRDGWARQLRAAQAGA